MLDINYPLTYKEFCEFVNNNIDNDLTTRCKEVIEHEHIYNRVINTIKSDREDIIKDNSYTRMLVYTICEIYAAKAETISDNIKVRIYCYEFVQKELPTNFYYGDDDRICGCDYAPEWFRKAKRKNGGYDMDINSCYIDIYRWRKIGVKYHR